MLIGIFMSVTDEQITPAVLGPELENRGFESLFVPEHTHIPAGAVMTDGSPIPRDFRRNLDPFVTLTAAAATTTRLRLGTAVTLVPQRDPILLAKTVASLDLISGGRAELGAGAGWLRDEIRNHGADPATRVRLLTERLAAMKQIWALDEAEFHGELVDFGTIQVWPKPVRRSGPPVWLAGWGRTTLARVIASGDGWMAPSGLPVDEVAPGLKELADRAGRAGVPVPPVVVTLFDPSPPDLVKARDLGVHRVLLGLPEVAGRDETLRRLDAYARIRP